LTFLRVAIVKFSIPELNEFMPKSQPWRIASLTVKIPVTAPGHTEGSMGAYAPPDNKENVQALLAYNDTNLG